MKLRNKKTGEIKDFDSVRVLKNSDCTLAQFTYDTLAELNEDWEDYEPKEPQEEIGRQLVSSPYDKDFYWADEEQQEAFREFCREEDNRPENRRIPSDVYSDNAQCLAKEFGGVLSGNDRPRNMSEYNALREGLDFKMVREENERLGKERWLRFVREHGLEKFVEHREPLIKDEKIRKAVRAWAEACFNDNEFWVIYLDERNFTLKANRSDAKATFYSDNKIDGIEEDEFYTITELCGEEE